MKICEGLPTNHNCEGLFKILSDIWSSISYLGDETKDVGRDKQQLVNHSKL